MEEEKNDLVGFTPEMVDYVRSLCDKSLKIFEKTKQHSNGDIIIDKHIMPFRVDDIKLFYIGAYLLPNIMNYLINILPQFIYPYVVAYLQDLSSMREDPITINELYNFLIQFNHGNIHECPETEG